MTRSAASMACLLLAFSVGGCTPGTDVVGGRGVEGRYSALVDLRPGTLNQVALDVYEDFTCPACQTFSLEVVPALQRRYGTALVIRTHYVAAPSTDPAAVILHDLAALQGKESDVAAALWASRLEHRTSLQNTERVRDVAIRFGLDEQLDNALADPRSAARVSAEWQGVAYKVSHFPYVQIEGEIVTNGEPQNLQRIIDSLLRTPH